MGRGGLTLVHQETPRLIWWATKGRLVVHEHAALAKELESGSEAAVDAALKDPRAQPR